MSKPLISIYVTNYNYSNYIRQAIDSVLIQSWGAYEIILIDDGSTDSSRKIIEEYRGNNSLKIVYQNNMGLNRTNNVAWKMAGGDWVMRLDADDYLHKDALKILSQKIEDNPEAAMVFPDFYNVDAEGRIINRVKKLNFSNDVSLFDLPAHGACTLIRRKVLEEVGGYDERFTRQDGYDLWLKIAGKYPVVNVNRPLFYYRQHGKSITDNESGLLKARREIKAAHFELRNIKKPHVLAILPVRGAQYDTRSLPFRKLGNSPLISWSMDAALQCPLVNHLLVSSPDSQVQSFVQENYDLEKVSIHRRPEKLSRVNLSVDETIIQAVQAYSVHHEMPDLLLVLYAEAPLRGSEEITEAIHTLYLFDVNAVEAVRKENGIFYQHDGNGLKHTNNNYELQLEREILYKRVGGMHVIRSEVLLKNGSLSCERTGHIELDQRAAHFIRTEDDWAIAELFVNQMQHAV